MELWNVLFDVGIVLQTIIFIAGKFDATKFWKSLKYTFYISTILTLVSADGRESAGISIFSIFSFMCIMIFPLIFGAIFRDVILTKINATIILFYTILFWFIFLTDFYTDIYYSNLVAIPFLIITAYIFRVLFIVKDPNSVELRALLSWFFILIISLAVFDFLILRSATLNQGDDQKSLYSIFAGMTFMYIAVHVWYFFIFNFRNSKSKSSHNEEAVKLRSDLIDHRINAPIAITIIAIQTVVLITNHYLNLISDYAMISLWFLIIPQIFSRYLDQKKETDIKKQSSMVYS